MVRALRRSMNEYLRFSEHGNECQLVSSRSQLDEIE